MKSIIFILLPGLLSFCLVSRSAADNDRPSSIGWNREAAAKYLDDRMELWFAKAKKLRTGKSETSCVSCHTTIPYMLARPALRRAMGVTSATEFETRVLEEAQKRIENFADHEPFYDFDEPKKIQARGTEAVLNALIMANSRSQTRPGFRPGIIQVTMTKMAFDQLWQAQRPDGSWDWLNFGLEPFESSDAAYFGATLAALAVGLNQSPTAETTSESNPGIEKLQKYLKGNLSSQSLFNRTWLLLASIRMKNLLTENQRQSLIKEIESRQCDDGGWALQSLGPWRWSKPAEPFQPPGTVDAALLAKSDGYATGLIVYTLRRAGLSPNHPAVSKGLLWLKTNQLPIQLKDQKMVAWRTHSLNVDREHGGDKGEPWRRMFMSDLATGFAVLALISSD
jgi:hypothetical protein